MDILKPYSVEASENEKSSESSLDPGHLQNQTGFYYCEQGIVEKQIQEKITHKGKIGSYSSDLKYFEISLNTFVTFWYSFSLLIIFHQLPIYLSQIIQMNLLGFI